MSYIEDNESNNNELDPFSEQEERFETRQIRYTKAHTKKRKTELAKKEAEEKEEQEKNASSKKSLSFLRELPSRADKRKYYTTAVIVFASIVGVFLLILVVIIPWRDKEEKAIEQLEAIDESNEIIDSITDEETEEELNEKTERLKNLFEKTYNNPDAQYEYATALLDIYELNRDIKSIDALAEEFLNNKKIAFPTDAYFLMRLQAVYLSLSEDDKYVKTIEKLLAMPDDEDYDFNAESFTSYKQKLRERLEAYKQAREK